MDLSDGLTGVVTIRPARFCASTLSKLVVRFLPDYPIFLPADTQLGNLLILCDNLILTL